MSTKRRTTYHVSVVTSDKRDADSYGDAWIVIHDDAGNKTKKIRLAKGEGRRQRLGRDQRSDFEVDSKYLSSVDKITMGMFGKLPADPNALDIFSVILNFAVEAVFRWLPCFRCFRNRFKAFSFSTTEQEDKLHVEEVQLRNEADGGEYTFACQSWLSATRDRTFVPTSAKSSRIPSMVSLSPVKYEVVVITADEKGWFC